MKEAVCSLCYMRQLKGNIAYATQNIGWQIGNGSDIIVWSDNWKNRPLMGGSSPIPLSLHNWKNRFY